MFGNELLVWVIAALLTIGGAFVIALPDIPHVRLILPFERIKEGFYAMESTRLRSTDVGYEELFPIIENQYSVRLPENTWGFRTGFHTMSRYGFEAIYAFTDPDNEDVQIPLGKELGDGEDYRVMKNQIKHRISLSEAKLRAVGFVILGMGFSAQTFLQIDF